MKEVRCKCCKKLLFFYENLLKNSEKNDILNIEIKCIRCKEINKFNI